jgi:hypothetical protein
MQHFKLRTRGIDTRPYLDEIEANPQLWAADTTRQEKIVTQRETQAIGLRSHAPQADLDSRVRRAMPLRYTGQPSALSAYFPLASAFVDELVASMGGRMGRAVMANLKPHGSVYLHTDDGLYWLLRDRYHFVLKSVAGSRLRAGGEEVRMQEGELWWFDPTVPHEAFNDSDENRVHIIVDVLSRQSMRSFRKRLARAPLRSSRAFANAAFKRGAWTLRERFAPASNRVADRSA